MLKILAQVPIISAELTDFLHRQGLEIPSCVRDVGLVGLPPPEIAPEMERERERKRVGIKQLCAHVGGGEVAKPCPRKILQLYIWQIWQIWQTRHI